MIEPYHGDRPPGIILDAIILAAGALIFGSLVLAWAVVVIKLAWNLW